MRHVKLRPGTAANAEVLNGLIDAAYSDIKKRVENPRRERHWRAGAPRDEPFDRIETEITKFVNVGRGSRPFIFRNFQKNSTVS